MSFLVSFLIILGLFAIFGIFNYFRIKNTVVKLSYVEFKKDLRKVQLIDVREKEDFNFAHINGARNIPLSQLSFKASSIRKDQPIYLCDKNGTVAPRAALTLKKQGFKNLFMLKNGLQSWEENLKTKK